MKMRFRELWNKHIRWISLTVFLEGLNHKVHKKRRILHPLENSDFVTKLLRISNFGGSRHQPQVWKSCQIVEDPNTSYSVLKATFFLSKPEFELEDSWPQHWWWSVLNSPSPRRNPSNNHKRQQDSTYDWCFSKNHAKSSLSKLFPRKSISFVLVQVGSFSTCRPASQIWFEVFRILLDDNWNYEAFFDFKNFPTFCSHLKWFWDSFQYWSKTATTNGPTTSPAWPLPYHDTTTSNPSPPFPGNF